MPESTTSPVSFRVPVEMMKGIDEVCRTRGLSLTALTRQLYANLIEAQQQQAEKAQPSEEPIQLTVSFTPAQFEAVGIQAGGMVRVQAAVKRAIMRWACPTVQLSDVPTL